MNNALIISASLEEQGLLVEIVERLAACRKDTGFSPVKLPSSDLAAIGTSSTEAYVSGVVAIGSAGDDAPPVQMPFNSSFLFTCIKEKKSRFQLTWALSLS